MDSSPATATIMTDEVRLQSPLGPIGVVVDCLVITRYLRRLIEDRCQTIKQAAEMDR